MSDETTMTKHQLPSRHELESTTPELVKKLQRWARTSPTLTRRQREECLHTLASAAMHLEQTGAKNLAEAYAAIGLDLAKLTPTKKAN